MSEFAKLPETFESLQASSPEGLLLSERLIEPVIIISRAGDSIVARLGGAHLLRGNRYVLRAPSNRHVWVVDGATVRPLPRDAAILFEKILSGASPDNLSYSQAIKLVRDSHAAMRVEADEGVFLAGRAAADNLDSEITIPGLTATLFPYQSRGVRWMWDTITHTGGLILADEMGLGKTLQIIALLLMDPPKADSPALIVCPTSLIANWVREFDRFASGVTVMVHRGANRAGIYRELQRTSIVVTTYDTMVNDISIFSSFEWSWVICDEAQAIKNPDSNRRNAIVSIPRRRTIPMTGTPVENSLLDLWSLADFAIPGLLGSRREFEAAYPDSLESAQTIGRLTDPIILKRRVADVASDLPELINIDLPLELDDLLADHYLMVRAATLAKYPLAGALVATLQLQLVCAHPWLRRDEDIDHEGDESEVLRSARHPLMTPKMERAVTLLREAFTNGRKVIVFALFNRIGDLLMEAVQSLPNAYWGAINGSTPQQDRQAIIDDYTNHDGPGCLVLNPKAAGAGLNITAATVVIHFTPVWNPALEAQASARAHRRGQTRPVTIYRLFYKDTVEEVMIDRSLWKSELANESVPVSSRDATDLKRALEITPERS
ncbi:DEAD/DEAH box helicase [Pseudomonas fluorescens]|uniref:DEAD/DEAH box helicase n=1 Tax=Pseudomonas fluorescens TaxID=294 RepID=UPI001404A06A|nr:DEAD/DEAH box helicase [Pseudomonas fluorescens]NHN66345.1 DEAD/DEAH box helicase [Pseudomonas fluorescens]